MPYSLVKVRLHRTRSAAADCGLCPRSVWPDLKAAQLEKLTLAKLVKTYLDNVNTILLQQHSDAREGGLW